jgi:hypothetical protein
VISGPRPSSPRNRKPGIYTYLPLRTTRSNMITRRSSSNESDQALPQPFYFFFVWVEPVLTLAGALYALTQPRTYFGNLVPTHLDSLASSSDLIKQPMAVVMAIHQLGNCP